MQDKSVCRAISTSGAQSNQKALILHYWSRRNEYILYVPALDDGACFAHTTLPRNSRAVNKGTITERCVSLDEYIESFQRQLAPIIGSCSVLLCWVYTCTAPNKGPASEVPLTTPCGEYFCQLTDQYKQLVALGIGLISSQSLLTCNSLIGKIYKLLSYKAQLSYRDLGVVWGEGIACLKTALFVWRHPWVSFTFYVLVLDVSQWSHERFFIGQNCMGAVSIMYWLISYYVLKSRWAETYYKQARGRFSLILSNPEKNGITPRITPITWHLRLCNRAQLLLQRAYKPPDIKAIIWGMIGANSWWFVVYQSSIEQLASCQ